MSNEEIVDRMLDKASEAFVLAIELYNRPSIKYRVEGFSFFVCNAWELMLKAKIIRDRGIEAIYYKDNQDRTIALERCLSLIFSNEKDPLRRNLEDIIGLRNTSTHFIVEEYEQIYVGLFQACVTNFDDKMYEFHRRRIGDIVPPHFLTLSMTANPATPESIRAKYSPDIAEKFLFDEAEIEQELQLRENQRYSTVMVTEIAVVKNPKNADLTVAFDSSSNRPIRTAKVFQDPKNTHPLSVKNVIEHVNKSIEKKGIVLMACGKTKNFTQNDWSLFMRFYDFKNNSEYAYCHVIGNGKNYTYSRKVIDFIVNTIVGNPEEIIDSLKEALRKGRD